MRRQKDTEANIHSPHEIISKAGKDRAQLTTETETKLKLIHPYQQQISIN